MNNVEEANRVRTKPFQHRRGRGAMVDNYRNGVLSYETCQIRKLDPEWRSAKPRQYYLQ